ncbi:MAG TPA: hypothetical protein VFK04_10325 [Gemmatimonadaceae bacterium]|nr:hypothetical protein [Gemmatimonadaceae bacterium]
MQRTNFLWNLVVLLLATLSSAGARAQARPLPRGGVISGTVRDSTSGLAARRISVCAYIRHSPSGLEYRCAVVDTLGHYRLDNLPVTGVRVDVQCATIVGLGKGLADDSISLAETAHLRRDWTVSTAGCDHRPVRRVTGVFRGHYRSGFESSEFVPCAADAWFISGDSLDSYRTDARRAWATWRPDAGKELKWPDVPLDDNGNPRYYVRWRGTVVGPGHYGHMGVSPFEFLVDTVLELRRPGPQDCVSP